MSSPTQICMEENTQVTMKQYTNESQTAKLIELGFEKPKNTQYIQRAKARNLHSPFIKFGEPEFEGSYSLGELIEMLPSYVEWKGNYYDLRIETDRTYSWVAYEPTKNDKAKILPVYDSGSCLIDILYNVLINLVALKDELTDAGGHNEYNQGEVLSEVFKLKEEGVV